MTDIKSADIHKSDEMTLDDLVEVNKPDQQPAPPTADGQETGAPAEQGAQGDITDVPADLDKNKPLNADARFRRVIEERNHLREERRQWLEDKAAQVQPVAPTQQPQQVNNQAQTQIPQWFTEAFGPTDDPRVVTAWNGFSAMTAEARSAAKQEALAELKSERDSEQAVLDEAKGYVEQSIQDLRDEHGDFDINAFKAHMAKYPLTDSEGNLDFNAGFALFQEIEAAKGADKSASRKKVAGNLGAGTGSGEPPKKEGVTSADIMRAERELGI